jgi:hypothetical protein
VKTLEEITRAYQVLDHIEAHPDLHDQDFWLHDSDSDRDRDADLDGPVVVTAQDVMSGCGTTACYAGWTVLLAGKPIIDYSWTTAVRIGRVSDVAADLLGLDGREEQQLFHDAEDLADVRKAVADIFGPRPDNAI